MEKVFKLMELQIDDSKPSGVVIRLNDEKGCVLRICRIPRKLVFKNPIDIRECIEITIKETWNQ